MNSRQPIISLALVTLLMTAALTVIFNQNKYRHLFIDLNKSRSAKVEMNTDYAQLVLDHSLLAKQSVIAEKAEKLGLSHITANNTAYLVEAK